MRGLFFIIIFIAAAFFGFKIVQDPGYALFVYHGWSVQMPLWVAILLFLFLFFCIYLFFLFFYKIILLKYSIKFWWLKRSFYKNQIKKQKK